jgi:type IV pilus assembly protein PilM
VIGLDIGTTRVRAVEVVRGRGAPTIQHYGEVVLPHGAVRDGEVAEAHLVVAALKRLWSEGKFSHREVIIGMGNQRVMVRNLELPWMPMQQIRAALPFQVQDALPVAVEDALLDFYPTSAADGVNGRSVLGLLVAATRDTVQANLMAVEGAGLRPIVVDLNAFALLRVHAAGPLADRVIALADIGARSTNVVITDQGVPRLVRTLPVGGQNATDAVASAMNVSMSEAELIKRQVGVGFAVPQELQAASEVVNQVAQGLIESIRNTFVYYAGNNPGRAPEAVVLSGGGAYLGGLGQYLSSVSRMPVMLADLLGPFQVARSADLSVVQGAEASVAVPLGLALGVAA